MPMTQAERRPTLVIIDGHSLLYRGFYATRPLTTSDGRPTNAVYAFTNMLLSLLEQVEPDAIVVAFDAPAPTFRHEAFTEYKAHRREAPETFRPASGDDAPPATSDGHPDAQRGGLRGG
jgi:DNA polymerase I